MLAVRGSLTLDLGFGRRVRPLGPLVRSIAAPPETVCDVIAAPYLGRTPRAMQDKLQVCERGSDMALAAHVTPVGRFTTTTVETVRFERPHTISFRLLRRPVPHVVETYELEPDGAWWAGRLASSWQRTVAAALDGIQEEAERRTR